MNKIYNNLNIENLIKTDWFNQINKEQMKQIRLTLKNNIDISLFAKEDYNKH